MKKLVYLLLLTFIANSSWYANAQTINNATVNILGAGQNVTITQFNSNHFVNLQLVGDGINVTVTQSGNTPQSFSLNISCYSVCPSSPYVVNQY
jgi:hypothetical protein